MWTPWLGRFMHKHAQECEVRARRQRSDDEIALALSTLPLYHVLLTLGPRDASVAPAAFARSLASMVGEERAARILADAMRNGVALVATCPRELAEHYCDELARRALPCAIAPA
jgi:ATP-dependent Clp protease adapter protein ClpS